jgi:peptidoglycan/LPS O-acetylase OafA/YrhL
MLPPINFPNSLMKPKLDIIQLFRALAALLVCFFHMKGILKQGDWGKFLFGNGSIGVPLFFMISGFIMYHTTRLVLPSWKSVKVFLLKRLIRIVPLYYFITLLYVVLLGNAHFYFIEHPRFLLPSLFFYPTYVNHIGPSYGMPPLAVGWSLNYEIYFYLLVGISMLFTKNRWWMLCGWLVGTTLLIPLLSNGYVMMSLSECYGYTAGYLSLMTNPVLLFFVFGIGMGALYNSKFEPPSLFWANANAVLAIVVFVLSYFQLIQLLPGWYNHLLSCGLLLFALLQRTKIAPISIPKPLVMIGNCSFSLYLIHPIVLTYFPKLLRMLGVQGSFEGWPYFFGVLLVIIALSYVSYVWVEQRLSQKIQSLVMKEASPKAG